MAALGYIEGENLTLEYRSPKGRNEHFPELVAELLSLNVDVIVTRGTPAALATRNATTSVAVVMVAIADLLTASFRLGSIEKHCPEIRNHKFESVFLQW